MIQTAIMETAPKVTDLLTRRRVVMALAVLLTSASPRIAAASEPAPEPTATQRQSAPQSGRGLMFGGSYMMAGGVALLITASYMTATHTPDWAGAIVGSVALTGAGATFVWLGSRRARRLRAWSDETGLRPPPDGRGLLVSGLVLGGGGIVSMIAYGGLTLGYCETNCFNPNQDAWFGIAGTAVGAGLGMVIAGAVLGSRHRKWRAADTLTGLSITPSFAFTPSAVQLGVAGRF